MVKDKKGIIGIFIFFIIMVVVLVLGFISVFFIGITDIATDEIIPIMNDITVGVVTDTAEINVSKTVAQTFTAVSTLLNALPWLTAFAYVLALVFSVVFATAYRASPNPAFIGVYVGLVILLIFGSIMISNAYQDIYEGTDELASRVQEQTSMSYLILYSPVIMAVIALLTGVYVFASPKQERGIV